MFGIIVLGIKKISVKIIKLKILYFVTQEESVPKGLFKEIQCQIFLDFLLLSIPP